MSLLLSVFLSRSARTIIALQFSPFTFHFSFQDNPEGDGVAEGTQGDEYMPYSVVEGVLFVMVEEVGTYGIKHAFGDDPPERSMWHTGPHGPDNHQCRPTHSQVECERESRMASQCDSLADDAGNDACPEKTKHTPSNPSAENREAYRRITAGYHDVDRYMVEDAQASLVDRISHGMVDRRGSEH